MSLYLNVTVVILPFLEIVATVFTNSYKWFYVGSGILSALLVFQGYCFLVDSPLENIIKNKQFEAFESLEEIRRINRGSGVR